MTDRRTLLRGALAAPLLLSLGAPAFARARRQRTVLLIELAGGNDGLNTVVPFADPAYVAARAALAVTPDQALRLDERRGLHPALEPLMKAWQARDLAVVEGLGYPRPNRSHFASIEVWDGGDPQGATEGWTAATLRALPGERAIDAVVLAGSAGPVRGRGVRAVVLRRPRQLLRRADRARLPANPTSEAPDTAVMRHILRTAAQAERAGDALRAVLAGHPAPSGFPRHRLGRQLATAAQLLEAGLALPVIKAQLKGFDTHAGQANRHPRLLKQLAEAIAVFRDRMVTAGRWGDVLVMTYAEFGRRVHANASGGTDHGTAAPHLVLGGAVRGGLYGAPPALTELDGGDLRYTTDFRRLQATARSFWGAPSGSWRPMGLLS